LFFVVESREIVPPSAFY
jgi:hypothetical protein